MARREIGEVLASRRARERCRGFARARRAAFRAGNDNARKQITPLARRQRGGDALDIGVVDFDARKNAAIKRRLHPQIFAHPRAQFGHGGAESFGHAQSERALVAAGIHIGANVGERGVDLGVADSHPVLLGELQLQNAVDERAQNTLFQRRSRGQARAALAQAALDAVGLGY